MEMRIANVANHDGKIPDNWTLNEADGWTAWMTGCDGWNGYWGADWKVEREYQLTVVSPDGVAVTWSWDGYGNRSAEFCGGDAWYRWGRSVGPATGSVGRTDGTGCGPVTLRRWTSWESAWMT